MKKKFFLNNAIREDVRNLILGYPSLTNKIFGTFWGEIHRVNPEILGYPRIPGHYDLTREKILLDFLAQVLHHVASSARE